MKQAQIDQSKAEISTDGVFLVIKAAGSEVYIPKSPEAVRVVGAWLK